MFSNYLVYDLSTLNTMIYSAPTNVGPSSADYLLMYDISGLLVMKGKISNVVSASPSEFASGLVTIMQNGNVSSGWTRSTTAAYANAVPVLRSLAVSTGGTAPFTTVFAPHPSAGEGSNATSVTLSSVSISIDAVGLTIPQMPAHKHLNGVFGKAADPAPRYADVYDYPTPGGPSAVGAELKNDAPSYTWFSEYAGGSSTIGSGDPHSHPSFSHGHPTAITGTNIHPFDIYYVDSCMAVKT